MAGAIVLAGLLGLESEPLPTVSAVPVSIVSDTEVVEAAAADNPSEELVTEDAATAPVETPPEPVPPTPTPPAPRPTPPTPAPTPRPTPPRPTPPTPRPTPPRPTPPRPAPPRPAEPTLDLDALAGRPNTTTQRGNRPRTGQQGQGSAPRAIGAGSLSALAAQITPHWNLNCDLPGANDLTIGVRVTLNENGGIVGAPRLTESRSDPVWRAASDGVLRAMRAAAPFDMPSGYEQQEIRFSFRTATMCGNR